MKRSIIGGSNENRKMGGYIGLPFSPSSEFEALEFLESYTDTLHKYRLSTSDYKIITPYVNSGNRLRVSAMLGYTLVFVAGLQLPHHAEIKKMTCFWTDPYTTTVGETGPLIDRTGKKPNAELIKDPLRDSDQEPIDGDILIKVDGKGNSPKNEFYSVSGTVEPKNVIYADVDNTKFIYCIKLDLPETSMFRGAVIEYTISELP